ncbi:unnamed protein product [Prorocentrum cordatum]|uniref:Sodium/calcium exchanger membrane region domain-containing protein n=1 Tax=Prorocentrum cordatum TaxID=2364126 RepID=A0ABN9T2B6_9DINO|nr:unnamed protein product [Polarella glacialis]
MYCFAGVACLADVFMAAIEKITSRRVQVQDRYTGKIRTVNVWNPTVANLTLMALGSSAPEILLSVIELMSNNMQSGELGPSTIVGSAAFNLLCIIAVCVSAIPSGEVRAIKELPVFAITATFSVLAYAWLLVILLWRSPNVVEWWEGVRSREPPSYPPFPAVPSLPSFPFLASSLPPASPPSSPSIPSPYMQLLPVAP